MYNDYGMNSNDKKMIRNEVAFTNLIEKANNDIIFQALDMEIKDKLVKILCAFTKESVNAILES